jgi:hypothetical protein
MMVVTLNGHREEFSLVPKLTGERILVYRERLQKIRQIILIGIQESSNDNSCNINDLSPNPVREDQTVADYNQQWYSPGIDVSLFNDGQDEFFDTFQ